MTTPSTYSFTAYNEILYLRRAKPWDFLRCHPSAVIYKNIVSRPSSYQTPLFCPANTEYNQPAMLIISLFSHDSMKHQILQFWMFQSLFNFLRRSSILFSKDCTLASRMEGSGGLFDLLRILRRQLAPWPHFLCFLFMQMTGSGLGLFPGKQYIIHVGLVDSIKENKDSASPGE
jgi:hypothetical protein